MTDQTASISASSQIELSKVQINYAVWMLLVVYILNFVDRQIVNILAEPIKRDLDLQDWQLGLLTGLAFAIFYTVLGVPIARYADRVRTNRVVVIGAALALWSGFTALCGLAGAYWHLLLARVGVGVGEAGCTPPAHSLISDLVPQERRASALAFYSMGLPIGTFLAFAFGGVVAQYLNWRWAFMLVGLPGVILAILIIATVKEPRTMQTSVQTLSTAPDLTFAKALAQLGRIPSYWYGCAAVALLTFVTFGQMAFLGGFYVRVHKMPISEVGIWLGTIIGGAGVAGTYLGGTIADRIAKRDKRIYYTLPAASIVLSLPLLAIALTAENKFVSLVFLAFPIALGSVWYGPVFASVQGMAPRQLRATAIAVAMCVANLVGLGLGPTSLGFLSSYLSMQIGLGHAEGLRWAILAASSVGLAAAAIFMIGRRHLPEDIARANRLD